MRQAWIRGGFVEGVAVVGESWQEPKSAEYWVPPEGTTSAECDETVGPGWSWDGSVFTAPPLPAPPALTHNDVNRERDRRNNQGQALVLNSGKAVSIATATREDFDNINFSADTALTMIAKTEPTAATWLKAIADSVSPLSAETGTMVFRDFYRLPQEVTYHEMAEIQVRITNNIMQVNQAAHLLKDMPEVPLDYQDDKWWPVIPVPSK